MLHTETQNDPYPNQNFFPVSYHTKQVLTKSLHRALLLFNKAMWFYRNTETLVTEFETNLYSRHNLSIQLKSCILIFQLAPISHVR